MEWLDLEESFSLSCSHHTCLLGSEFADSLSATQIISTSDIFDCQWIEYFTVAYIPLWKNPKSSSRILLYNKYRNYWKYSADQAASMGRQMEVTFQVKETPSELRRQMHFDHIALVS